MSISQHYNNLNVQIQNLRDHLLPVPEDFDPSGDYSKDIITKTIAFRVLAHAEIEYYLEERAKEVITNAWNIWKNQQSSGRVLMSLLAFSNVAAEPPSSIEPKQRSQNKIWSEKINLDDKIAKAKSEFFKNIKDNHGIKEANLCKILLPLGFPHDKFDTTWVNDINSFGEGRGDFAHKTSFGITKLPNPEDELKAVQNLLNGLKSIDSILEGLLKLPDTL